MTIESIELLLAFHAPCSQKASEGHVCVRWVSSERSLQAPRWPTEVMHGGNQQLGSGYGAQLVSEGVLLSEKGQPKQIRKA